MLNLIIYCIYIITDITHNKENANNDCETQGTNVNTSNSKL